MVVRMIYDYSACARQHLFRIPLKEGIAGHVAATKKTMTVYDAQSHPMFYSSVDALTGYTTQNLLCSPLTVDDR